MYLLDIGSVRVYTDFDRLSAMNERLVKHCRNEEYLSQRLTFFDCRN